MTGSSGIGRAALVVSAGILASRVLGFLRNVVLFGVLGLDTQTDLYVAAFSIPDYLFFLMAGGYLSITLVPILTRHHAQDDEAGARASFTAVFRIVTLLLMGLTAITLLAAGPLTRLLFPEVPDQVRLVGLTRIALTSQVFFGMGTLLMAAQYAKKRFLVPTLAPLIYNLSIISGGLLGWASGDPSPESFLWGGLVGAAIGNFGLQWWGARRAGMRLVRGTPWRLPAVSQYFAMALPLMIGQSVVALDEQWPRWFGQFAGEGAQAALTGARQLNMVPVGVIAQAVGVAAYPFLASLVSEGRIPEVRETVLRSVRSATAVGGLAAALVIGLAFPIVRVAYQYGAFGAEDTRQVASLLLLYALSIPFWPAHQTYARAYYAQRRMWTVVGIGTAATAVTVPLLWWLVEEFGVRGVAVGSSVGVLLYTIAIGAAWHRGGDPGERNSVVGHAVKLAVCTTAAGAAAMLTRVGLDRMEAPQAVILAVGAVAGGAVYLGLARLTRLAGLEAGWSRFSRSR